MSPPPDSLSEAAQQAVRHYETQLGGSLAECLDLLRRQYQAAD